MCMASSHIFSSQKAVSRLEGEKALAAASISVPSGIPMSSVSQRLDQRLEALQKSNVELTAHARELNSQRLQLTSQLEDATRIIRTHLPFVDASKVFSVLSALKL